MPLCMKHLHGGLRKESHLKHWGRLQYGLFLKGAGMELEDATRFFELAFSKVTPHDKFQKDYAYSFRHMYGKEGARKNYTPYSCMKIIMGTPPEVGGFHGCPYRHMPENQLSALLGSMSIGGQDAKGTFLSRAGVARMRQTRLSSPAQGGIYGSFSCPNHCVLLLALTYALSPTPHITSHRFLLRLATRCCPCLTRKGTQRAGRKRCGRCRRGRNTSQSQER